VGSQYYQKIKLCDGSEDATGCLNFLSGRLPVDGTVSGSGTFLVDSELPAGVTPADNQSNAVTIPLIGGFSYLFDGAAWDRAPGNAADGALVNLGSNNDVTVTGTVTANQGTPAATANRWPVQLTDGTDLALVTAAGAQVVDGSGVTQPVSAASLPLPAGAATAAGQLPDSHNVTVDNAAGAAAVNIQDGGNSITIDGTVAVTEPVSVDDNGGALTVDQATAASLNAEVQGDAAHDAAVGGNPVLAGAEARSSNGTAVANGDAVRLQADLVGRLVVSPYTLNDNITQGCATSTGTGDTALEAAAGAGIRTYVTSISVINTSTTLTYVSIKDGTTVIYEVAAPASTASIGGAVPSFPVPLRGSANTALNFASAAAVTTMRVCYNGFAGP